jgi:hypothetical protein
LACIFVLLQAAPAFACNQLVEQQQQQQLTNGQLGAAGGRVAGM